MKNILRKLHIGGNHDDQFDAERIIEGRTSHDGSGGAFTGGQRESATGAATPPTSAGSPTSFNSNDSKPSGLSTFFNAVKDSVGRVGQSPANSNEKSSNPITNAIGQLRQRLDSSKESSVGVGELDSSTTVSKRALSGPSPPGSIHRLANESPKDAPAITVPQTEEDYQVQIAMALSVSGNFQTATAARVVEKAQIEAAKRISLGLSPAVGNSESDTISYRYWACNVVDYDEIVPDGFYDVFGLKSDSYLSERMPLLADLQKMPVSDTSKIEVVLVDRQLDPDLVGLQRKAAKLADTAEVEDESLLRTFLAQKIALIVAEHMGGPVGSETDMLLRWQKTSWDVKTCMQNVVLTLGSLNIGLTRHRALLFKVLADHIHIPCQLVKGRHYPGVEEEGAVNIIKVDDNREYIIDLMGAPGALIPSDRTVANSSEVVQDDISLADISPNSAKTECSSFVSSAQSSPSSSMRSERSDRNKERKGLNSQKVASEVTEEKLNNLQLEDRHHSEPAELQGLDLKPKRLGAPVRPLHWRSPSWTEGIGLPGGRQVEDVSQLVIDAAKENPELAQKLHNALLESGVIPDMSPKQFQAQVVEVEKIDDDKRQAYEKKPTPPSHPPKRRSNSGQRPPLGSWKATQSSSEESVNSRERLQRLDSVEGLGERRPLEVPGDLQSPPVAIALALPAMIAAPLMPKDNSGGFVPVAAAAAAAATAAVVASTMVAAASKVEGGGDPKLEVPIAAAATATAAVVAATSAVAGKRTESSDASSLGSNLEQGGSGGKRGESADNDKGGVHRLRNADERRSEQYGSTPGNSRGAESSVGDGLDGEVSAEEERNSENMNQNRHKYDAIHADVAEWEIPWEDIVIGERIGLGSYGEVYRGDWHGSEVAVKKFLDQDLSGYALEEFRSEVRIMRRLRHPNVVLFMGAITRAPNLSIVTEFLPRGSLYRLIHRPNNQLDERRRLRMALDVAKGMNYLHSGNPLIVHRDLKSPNLLVDKNWVVKVCDFGLSRMKHNTFLSSKSTAGTPEWMAPEMLRNEPSNEKCDVYSFGVILWELATLQQPWSGLNPMQVVGAVGFQHRRLDIPPEMDPGLARIIRECWHDNPSLRPSFSQLMAALRPLQRPLTAAQSADVSRQGQASQGSTIQSQPQQPQRPHQEEPIAL